MIIVRAPLRVTLGGGGTDVPGYYKQHGGLCLAAAIDKYVYITLHETFVEHLIVKYSEMERVGHASSLKHPIVREAMALLAMDGRGLEIASHADIPAGTGLGSSGSFTTALLRALHTHNRQVVTPGELAEEACSIEIDRLGEPIGKQDQYMASFGGVQVMTFSPDGVQVQPIPMAAATRVALEENLLLFFTGYVRSASFARTQAEAYPYNMDGVGRLADEAAGALKTGDLKTFAQTLTRQWRSKRSRHGASNEQINQWWGLGMDNGALGGKLIGAGGGGFLMFYAEEKTWLRQAMTGAGLREVRFRFDYEGARVVVS